MPATMRLNNRLLPVLTAIVALMQLVDGTRIWLLLLVSLGGAWLVAYLWVRSLRRTLRLKREMRFGWAQVGDTLEERLTLANWGWAPALWVEITDHSTLPDHTISQVTGVGSLAHAQWQTRTVCTRRGLFTLGPTSIEATDPLGIYTLRLHDPAFTHLMVMPPTVPLPEIEVAPGGRSGEGRPRQNAPERSVSAASVREYVPGDSLHTIHWPTTARRETPYVHVFDGTPAGDWWVILDLDRRTQAGEGWDSTVEFGVVLAASLADRGLKARRAVGLAANAERLVWLQPQEGENYRWEILRSLALVTPGETSFAVLLERIRPNISQRSSAILITPDIHGGWLAPLMQWLWRGVVPTVLLLDPLSFGAPPSAQASAEATAGQLRQMGIACSVITREMLDRPELRPGHHGQWEWRVMPTGRAVPVNKPGDSHWKTLA
ncbi:MAG: DUF58 domain-containing protein [Chloroflexota bacterium]